MRVTANMATFPARRATMLAAVASIARQVDRVNVWGNGYDRAPAALKALPNVRFVPAGDCDLAGAGKFAFLADTQQPDYYLSLDDDFIYPADFAAQLCEAAGRFHAVTTLHGCRFRRPVRDYRQREVFGALRHVAEHQIAEMGGTGLMCHRPAQMRLGLEDFPHRYANDYDMMVAARRRNVPIMVLPHPADYLLYTKPGGFNIYDGVTCPQRKAFATAIEDALCGKPPRLPEIFGPLPAATIRRAGQLLQDTELCNDRSA